MRTPVFTDTIQIAIVVPDLDVAMRTYVHDYGIGPWEIYGFDPDNVANMRERAQQIGSELSLWSEVGAGTEVELRIPTSAAYGSRRGLFRRFAGKDAADGR